MNLRNVWQAVVVCGLGLLMSTSSYAGDPYTLTQGSSNTYSNLLTFDEPGTPTGVISPDAFASQGIAELQAGDQVPQVNDYTADPQGGPWVGSGNSFFGNFGAFITFAEPVTAASMKVWDPSGPPGPFGGGLTVFLFNDGVEVVNGFANPEFYITPSWGIVDDPMAEIDVAALGGAVFDEMRLLGQGFPATTFIDDLSWEPVPEPGGLLLIALGVVWMGWRRRP